MSRPIEDSQLLEGLSVAHLKVLGLWQAINTYYTTGRRSTVLNLLTAFAILYPLPYMAFQLLSVFYINLEIEQFSYLFLNFVPCLQVILKILVFWVRIDEQCDIFTLLKQDFLTCIPRHKMPKAEEIYKKNAKTCNAYCAFGFASVIMCITTWIFIPGISTEDITGTRTTKILGGWYPFPYSQTPYKEAVFCYEIILMTTHGLLIWFFECVMIQPLLCLCAHFNVLGYHVSSLRVADVVHSNARDGPQYLREELRAILLDYGVLLRYAAVIQDILNLLVTMILGTSVVVLVIGILQFMFKARDAMYTFHFLTYLFYGATEVFLICISSSTLETASEDIRFALYSSDWYLADKKFATMAQMMMIRTLKPLTLTAIKMYPVTMEIIMGLFQFTYTTAMVLSKSKE